VVTLFAALIFQINLVLNITAIIVQTEIEKYLIDAVHFIWLEINFT